MTMDSMAIMDLVSTASLGTDFSIIMDTDLGTNLSIVSENTDARLAWEIGTYSSAGKTVLWPTFLRRSNQSRCLQASNKARPPGMLLTKTSEACLDLSLPSCTNGDVAQVLEELHSGVVLAGLLRREERVHFAPGLRLALSQRGKILLTSLCSLLFPPGLLSCKRARPLAVAAPRRAARRP
jgi:hypothetical protein